MDIERNFTEKYKMLIPFLEEAFYKILLLTPAKIKEEEPLIEDFVCLILLNLLSEGFEAELTSDNIDRVERLAPTIAEILESYKIAMVKDELGGLDLTE